TRSRPTSAPTSSAYGRPDGGATFQDPVSSSVITSSSAAVSATSRVTTPCVDAPTTPYRRLVMRPRDGLRPTRPVHDAGMRIDPPPSDAWPIGAMPEATAAAAPPELPPGVR